MKFSQRRRQLVAGLALGAHGLAPVVAQESGPRYRALPRSRRAPTLTLNDLAGASWNLAEHRGEVVLLNFWASWCEPCVAELPSLERLARERAAARLAVVAINFREGEPAIRRFLQRQPMALPVLRDADGAAAKAWQVRTFPSTVVIGREQNCFRPELWRSGPTASR